MTLERRVFQLSSPQLNWLDKEAARLGISSAELLRRILDQYRKTPHPAKDVGHAGD